MIHGIVMPRALVAAVLALAVGAPVVVEAQIADPDRRKCRETVAKEGGKYVKAHMKEYVKCIDKNLQKQDGCDPATKRDPKLAKAESKLRANIEKRCGTARFPTPALSLKSIGYPGKCGDPDPSDGFTEQDLHQCIFETHAGASDRLLALMYGASFPNPAGPLGDKDLVKCQRTISKEGQKVVQAVLKEVQKCRNQINKSKLLGVDPVACGATAPFGPKLAKAESKARAKILGKCTDAHAATLDLDPEGICDPPITSAASAADCVVAVHRLTADNPDNTGGADLIDVEYAAPAFCGDNLVNDPLAANITDLKLGPPPEECDGTDDGACPGQCGAPDGDFACLCLDIPRQRVIEHENADLDVGWTGQSHDQGIVEGGGYVVDLYDCDGTTAGGGTDPDCTVGPSCALTPHQACANDGQCPGAGNFCRKRATAVGPHCNSDVQKACATDADCPPSGIDFCRKTPHGPPLPLSAGGVSVCVVNIFSEDITGTTSLDTGAASVRIRQSSVTHLASGTINQPCPTCGGFCDGAAGAGGGSPGTRTLCATDADCPAGVRCVTEAICSYGPNINQPCRRTPPFGNDTALFGTPSQDCPPNPGSNISGGGIDILFNPAVTGTVTLTPSVACPAATGFNFKTCIAGPHTGKRCCSGGGVCTGGTCSGGPENGQPCLADCPGFCREQCFCPSLGGGVPQRPNDCAAACVGGANDAQPCGSDTDCDPPNGFCHQGDCRLNLADTDSNQEGFCTAGPNEGLCSFTSIKGCTVDTDCASPACDFCLPGETCVFQPRQCFVNSGIVRIGSPGVPDRVAASQFCIAATTSGAVNSTSGLPGPGALLQPATVVSTGVLE